MWEFLLACTAAWIFFRVLDHVFRPRIPPRVNFRHIREGDFIKQIDGQYYIVRDVEVETSELSENAVAPVKEKPDLRVVK